MICPSGVLDPDDVVFKITLNNILLLLSHILLGPVRWREQESDHRIQPADENYKTLFDHKVSCHIPPGPRHPEK